MTSKSSSYGVVQGKGAILPEQSVGLFKTLNKLSVSLKFRTCLDHWRIYFFIKQGLSHWLSFWSLLLSLLKLRWYKLRFWKKNLPSHNMGPDFALCHNTTENMTKFLSHSNASFFIWSYLQFGRVKVLQNFTTTLLKAVIFQFSSDFCRKCSSTLGKKQVPPPV
jgi:hypothetical protein